MVEFIITFYEDEPAGSIEFDDECFEWWVDKYGEIQIGLPDEMRCQEELIFNMLEAIENEIVENE
jgi:hypothetical protein